MCGVVTAQAIKNGDGKARAPETFPRCVHNLEFFKDLRFSGRLRDVSDSPYCKSDRISGQELAFPL